VPLVSVTPNVSVTCASNTVVITSTVNPATSTYTWSGPGIVGSVNSSSITANAIGNYSLSITNPFNGCVNNTALATVGINTVAPTLSVSLTSSVLTCATNNSTLTAVSSATNPIVWTIPSGASSSNPVIGNTTGDYIATIIDGINGCSTSQTITLSGNIIPPNSNAGAAAIMSCLTSTASLLGSTTTTDAVSYSWNGPSVTSITSGSNSAAPLVNTVGVYTLTITNLVTGCAATSTVNVTQDNVVAAFSTNLTSGDAPLAVNFTDASTGAVFYNWNFGNGGTSINQNPSTVYNNAGTYTVVLIASSANCSDTATKIIIVEDPFTLEIPNVFTPNGDGANDLFHIKITGAKSAEGYIYNRWGQLLHSWDALNVSWDGKASNGENCPDGNYYYIIKVIDKHDEVHNEPGFVLIIR
jgi:gliding motility-associated-like protein